MDYKKCPGPRGEKASLLWRAHIFERAPTHPPALLTGLPPPPSFHFIAAIKLLYKLEKGNRRYQVEVIHTYGTVLFSARVSMTLYHSQLTHIHNSQT